MPSEMDNSEVTYDDPGSKNIRIVTLQRSEAIISLGFSIRGGVEHGLGHFVSSVEPGSEADRQGLRAGDEILTICGLPIVGATHKEVVNFVSTRWRVDLEIRRIGAIPVKNRKGDPISWIPCHQKTQLDKCQNNTERKKQKEIISIQVASPSGKRSLGCSIYKGRHPEDHGIFVQATKPGGLARRAGLRPGDQILECNGINFEEIDLAEAVVHLKSGKQLDLLIRKGCLDFLTGESSGYDSSSGASANGVHSNKPKSKARVAFKTDDHTDMEEEKLRRLAEERKLLESQMEVERRKLEREQEALRKEAEKLEADKKKFEEDKKKQQLTKTNSNSSETSGNGNDSSGSDGLASALQNEIARRRKAASSSSSGEGSAKPGMIPKPPISRAEPKLSKALPAGMLKNDQHDQLMEEFRRVHRKMFANIEDDNSEKETEQKVEVKETANEEVESQIIESPKTNAKPVAIPSDEKLSYTPKLPPEKRQQQQPENSFKPKCPPPPPPARSSSMTPTSSSSSSGEESSCPPPSTQTTVTFKSDSESSDQSEGSPGSPGIPTPDYDSSPRSSPTSSRRTASDERPSARSSPPASPLSTSSITLSSASSSSSGSCTYLGPRRQLVKTSSNQLPPSSKNPPWHMTTFSKRHPRVEVGSLESFCMDEGELTRRVIPTAPIKPPDFYFDPPKSQVLLLPSGDSSRPDPDQFDFLPRQAQNRSVRFDEGSAAVIASHDYRIAHASGRSDARHLESELLQTLKKSGVSFDSSSTSSPSSSSGVTSDDEFHSRRLLKSPKKHAAPPPPPPPPAIVTAKVETQGPPLPLKNSASLKGID